MCSGKSYRSKQTKNMEIVGVMLCSLLPKKAIKVKKYGRERFKKKCQSIVKATVMEVI